MIWRALPLCLLPAFAVADPSPEALIKAVENHCLRIDVPSTFYDLPTGWREQNTRQLRKWLPTKAIEEGIDYAGFITWQTDVSMQVDPDRAWPLTLDAYEDQLSDEQSYALSYNWTRLYKHIDTGAHLFVAAGDDVDDIEELHEPTCYLWHPEADHPLNAAIIARWDVPFAHRFSSQMGQATFAWNDVSLNGQLSRIETRVIRPNVSFTEGLAPVALKLRVLDF